MILSHAIYDGSAELPQWPEESREDRVKQDQTNPLVAFPWLHQQPTLTCPRYAAQDKTELNPGLKKGLKGAKGG